jgi:CubicO group peptidase (beta-lactamase class C family)
MSLEAPSVEMHGFCDEKFSSILEVFESNFSKGMEDGATVAATKDGELVVDLWAGTKDRDGNPWEKDTVVMVASGTKLAASLCGHMCLDRGLLELDEKVTKYWPEFGTNGKEDITVRMIFSHTSAIPGYLPPIPFSTQLDWAATIKALENQAPLWEPGMKSGYHGITYGHLVGELVRRVTGLTPGKFLKQEVTELTGIDFSIGFPRNQFHRMATINLDAMIEGQGSTGELAHVTDNSLLPPAWQGAACLEAEIPSSNGMTNARGIAQLLAIYANGGSYKGYQFLSDSTIDEVLTEQFYGLDLVMGDSNVPAIAVYTGAVQAGPCARRIYEHELPLLIPATAGCPVCAKTPAMDPCGRPTSTSRGRYETIVTDPELGLDRRRSSLVLPG